jgi:diacylglycerol kinase (ATP)
MDILPAGTGNDIVTSIHGEARNPLLSVFHRIIAGAPELIDVVAVQSGNGLSDERIEWVLGVTTIGFDSHVNERANSWSIGSGLARYSLALIRELPHLKPIPYEIQDGDGVHHRDGILCAVGNGGIYGGGMRICPDAELSDGLLDVTFVVPVPRRTLIRLFPTVLSGTHVQRDEVLTWRTSSIRIDSPGTPIFGDGEPLGRGSVSLTCIPSALRILRTPRQADSL